MEMNVVVIIPGLFYFNPPFELEILLRILLK